MLPSGRPSVPPTWSSASREILVCFSHLRWNFVFQRPQHLLARAAKDYRVFLFEEPRFAADNAIRLERTATPEGVTVLTPMLPEGLRPTDITRAQRRLFVQLLAELRPDRLILWYYTPMALTFSRHLVGDACVYDNMDELSAFKGAHPRLLALERELFRKADVVFTGGHSLYEAKRDRHRNIHPFPSSVDVAHFAKARRRGLPAPADQASIAPPRLGFFGVIDERMDVDLVARLADLRPDWNLVIIGPVVKIDPATLPRRPNIHWLGQKPYAALPDYLAGWDVGLMPFAINESTRFISPTKTPEFLAAGVPVVSTPIRDVVRPYGDKGLVAIADDAEAFLAAAERYLKAPRKALFAAVDRHLAQLSWDKTWLGMRAHIASAVAHNRRFVPVSDDPRLVEQTNA
jgi:glycosyltransferase involved in cell wall biosynthesis